MNTRTLDVLTVLGVVSAVLTTGLVIKREVAQPGRAVDSQSSAPSPVADWEQYVASGRLIGSESAPLKIVEFADFQCPACRSLHQLFLRLRQQRPNDFAISYHYVPLSYHAQAYPAARAAECAADQGRFEQYHNALFAHFDSLNQDGLFMRIARSTQVPDLQRFQECIDRKDRVARIDADAKIALDKLKIRGTPTTLVNGRMYTFAPSLPELNRMMDEAKSRAGRP